ncbi:hypothetical protein [Streptomyces sp. NPDC002853]
MPDLIRHLTAWVRLLLIPHPTPTTTASTPPRSAGPDLSTPRSRYGLDALLPLTGEASRLVRPYLTAHEQHTRRRELALATLGLDMPGPYWIHGVEVAR